MVVRLLSSSTVVQEMLKRVGDHLTVMFLCKAYFHWFTIHGLKESQEYKDVTSEDNFEIDNTARAVTPSSQPHIISEDLICSYWLHRSESSGVSSQISNELYSSSSQSKISFEYKYKVEKNLNKNELQP